MGVFSPPYPCRILTISRKSCPFSPHASPGCRPAAENLRRLSQGSKILGGIGVKVAGLVGEEMSIILNLVVTKYACSEGWERV